MAYVIRNAITDWRQAGLIDEKISDVLLHDIHVIPFDWKRLAKYSFWVSIICIITSVGAVFADKALLKLLQSILDAPYSIKFIGLLFLSAGLYVNRRSKSPEKVFSNEAILFLGVLFTAGVICQLGKVLDTGSGHFSLLLLFAVYGLFGFWFKSNLIWSFALASFGDWLDAETGYVSGWGILLFGDELSIQVCIIWRDLNRCCVSFGQKQSI